MSVEIEFLLGTNPDEKLERRAPRTVSYVDISIYSFFACVDILWDQTPRGEGKAGWLSGLKRSAKKKTLKFLHCRAVYDFLDAMENEPRLANINFKF